MNSVSIWYNEQFLDMDTGEGSSQIHYLNIAKMVTVYASYIYDGQKVNVFFKNPSFTTT